MATRKKSTKEVSEKKKEVVRPVVTQVVEVIEVMEEREVTAQPKSVKAMPPPEEEKSSENEEVAPPDEVKDEEPQKKEEEKEVISDLFNKKDTVGIPEISMHKSNSSRTMIIWSTAVITVAVLVGGALFISTKGVNLPDLSFTMAKPSPTPTEAPSPTPKPVSRGDISIQVLNGGGVVGAASKMKAFLEEKGYTVADTGNTDDYTYDKTAVLVKPGKEAYAALLNEDLADDYTLEATPAALPSDSSYDAQVIVGKE